MGGTFPKGITAVPFGSHMKTLPGGTSLVLGTLTCSPLCRTNCFGFAFQHELARPHVLGTVIDQTTTVSLLSYSIHPHQLGMLLGFSRVLTSIKHCYQSICCLFGVLGSILQAYVATDRSRATTGRLSSPCHYQE